MSEDRYPFSEVEPKWNAYWKEHGVHRVDLDNPGDDSAYILVMFSYPSSSKLHIGHWWNYGPTDTYARFRRMNGAKVFEPMGFDSFGLPAENYAIKMNTHPKKVTEESISHITGQLSAIGAMYDWDKMVVTSRPEYYKWTQWLFLQLHKHGLAYQKEGPVNWCPSCQTVLAHEQVLSEGQCERCGTEITHPRMLQWHFRITNYAEKLLDGHKDLDWPASTIKSQKDWIGKSTGSTIKFPLEKDPGTFFEVFTTRPDTLFGVTYVVIAPEHPMTPELTTEEQKGDVDYYVDKAMRTSEIDRIAEGREKTGVFTGSYAIHPLTGKKLPIWVADYVLATYGTGMVMAVPAHDQRDFEFAIAHSLPIEVVIRPANGMLDPEEMEEAYEEPGIMVNSGDFNGISSIDGKKVVTKRLVDMDRGGPQVTYKLRDWSISRQRYWGAPIPIIHCPKCGVVPVPEENLPVELPEEIEEFRPKGSSPLGAVDSWMNCDCPKCGGPAKRDPDTMDTFVCSSFYHLRYLANKQADEPFNMERMKNWFPIDTYVGGPEHATGHLIYFRFITQFLHDIGYCPVSEPVKRLIHQGLITRSGHKMSKSKGNVVNPEEFITMYGSDVFRMFLMFMGDYKLGGDWSDTGITGIERFVNRIWRLIVQYGDTGYKWSQPEASNYPSKLMQTLHATVKSVTEDLQKFEFNTAISRMMELVNELYLWIGDDNSKIDPDHARAVLHVLVRVMAPFAPHFCEEAYHRLGGTGNVVDAEWPSYDEHYLVADTYEMVVMVNGKVRDRIEVSTGTDKATMEEMALKSDKIQAFLEKGTLRKAIVVPDKLVNLVIT